MSERFRNLAAATAAAIGSPWAFLLALATCIAWAVSGPLFHWSDTWQLVINTGTTIATFLVVFLIQNTQNRDALAIHLKLDELLRAVETARTRLVNVENCTDEELEQLRHEFQRIARWAALVEPGAAAPPSRAKTSPR
jgi:low affinity Fe/Cu permease